MKEPILILHGWQKSGKDYADIQKIFEEKGYTVFAPDMPGFGNETLSKEVMNIDDYVDFVKNFLQKQKNNKVILIGHSFGGRVAAKFAAKYPEKVSKLILTGAPLIKKPLSIQKRAIASLVKIGKHLVPGSFQTVMKKGIYRSLGEWDYYKAGALKKTFQNVIAEDIAPVLPHISVPTLLLWGENDTFVRLSIGREIAGRVPHATIKSFPHITHKFPYESPRLFAQEVLQFIQ